MQFVEYITSLAPEGATVLFLKQLPKGQCIPYLPEAARIKDGEPWFGNIGLYLPDRFTDGPRAQSRMVEQVWCMMLDDIGTKSAEPPLPPTWIIETSPGNHQWVYVFDVDYMPNKAKFAAALKAIADAGFTDPGANNPVRNFRIPGSYNRRKDFNARLVEFHPEREFKLDDICQAFGVTPGEASGETIHLELKDDGNDDVLAWANEKGYLLDPPNSAGWASVLCPNHEEHSNDDVSGRYFPASRAFKCMHGHCVDWNSRRYLDWVAEQGGPNVEHGIRDDLLAVKLASLTQLTPTDAFPDEAARVIAEVDRREAGRVEKKDWFERFAYISSDDCYFDLVEQEIVSRSTFNALFRHIECRSIHNNRLIPASHAFDELRQSVNARVAHSVTYAAGNTPMTAQNGRVYANMWRDHRIKGHPGKSVQRWLDHVERVVPVKEQREHLLDMFAFKMQNPDKKINHGAMVIGEPSAGKDTMTEPFLRAIGKANVEVIRNEEVLSQWGYMLENEVLVVNELHQSDAKDRRSTENFLKPLLAAPPEYLTVNRKGLHPYQIVNRLFIVAFSNWDIPLVLPSNDRRWFVIKSPAPRMDEAEARSIWDWYDKGDAVDVVADYLWSRDVSQFNAGAPAPWTEAKQMLIESGLSANESTVLDMIQGQHGPFARGLVMGPWQRVADLCTSPGQSKIYAATVLHALREAKWIDKGLCHSRQFPTRRHIYCAPDHEAMSKSELRNLAEAGEVSGLRIVN
jgi:hypothetical protein